jgi:hypothetical protein
MIQVLERDMERNQALELVVPVQQGVGLLMVEMEVEVPLVVVITVLEVQHMFIVISPSRNMASYETTLNDDPPVPALP